MVINTCWNKQLMNFGFFPTLSWSWLVTIESSKQKVQMIIEVQVEKKKNI